MMINYFSYKSEKLVNFDSIKSWTSQRKNSEENLKK